MRATLAKLSKMLLNDKESQLLSKTRELLLPELMIKRMEF